MESWRTSNFGAEVRNPGRRSVGLLTRVMVVRLPERRQVPAEVQFEVARNAVTDIVDLGTARLCTGQGQHWEEQVVARLKLCSCRRSEPIDLGLRRGQGFTVERGQTPDERIDKRVEVTIVQRAVHPTIALGDISIEIVAAEDDLECTRAADQAWEPFQCSAPPGPVRRRSRGCRIGRFAGWRSACRRPARTRYRCRVCGRESWRCSRLAWTRGVAQSRAKGPAPLAVQLPCLRPGGR